MEKTSDSMTEHLNPGSSTDGTYVQGYQPNTNNQGSAPNQQVMLTTPVMAPGQQAGGQPVMMAMQGQIVYGADGQAYMLGPAPGGAPLAAGQQVVMPQGVPGHQGATQPVVVIPVQQTLAPGVAAYPPGMAIPPPGVFLRPQIPVFEPDQSFCTPRCNNLFWIMVMTYVVVMVICTVLALFFAPFLVINAIAPGAVILFYLQRAYGHCVTRCQMTLTFLEAVAWMIPLTVLLILYMIVIQPEMDMPEEGLCSECVAGYAFQAYILAGLLEEALKYVTVRRIMNAPFVVDPRSLVVYGTCAACGFAMVENILYILSGNIVTALARSMTSIPLHCACGMIMGCGLAETKFFGKGYRFYHILVLPIIIHGSYDMILFTTGYGSGKGWAVSLGLLSCIIIVVSTYLFLRWEVVRIQRRFASVDLHAKILNGEVPIPGVCCREICADCCML